MAGLVETVLITSATGFGLWKCWKAATRPGTPLKKNGQDLHTTAQVKPAELEDVIVSFTNSLFLAALLHVAAQWYLGTTVLQSALVRTAVSHSPFHNS